MRRAVALCLSLLACHAHAITIDGHVDLYGVNLDAATASLHFEEQSLFGGSSSADAQVDAGARPEIGIRAMLEDRELPWVGVAELGSFATGSPQLDLEAVQIALAAGVRAPQPLLARHGRGLRPYLLVGISSVVFDGHAEAGGIRVPVNTSSGFLSSGAADTVPVFAAGLEWQLSPRAGIVIEYRWREYDVEGFASNSWVLPTSNASVDGTLDASGLLVGISWWPRPPAAGTGPLSPGGPGAARMPAPEAPATEPPASTP